MKRAAHGRATQFLAALVTGLMMLLAVGFAPTSMAASPPNGGGGEAGSSTEVRYIDHGRALTKDEKQALVSKEELTTTFTPNAATEVQAQSIGIDYATRCGTASAAHKAYNASNQKLYEYRLNGYWCWDGSSVRSYQNPYVNVQVTTLGQLVGWSFEGNSTAPTLWKMSSWYYRAFAQGHFKLSPLRVGSIQNTYPWVQIDMKGDGTYYAKWGGGS